MDAQHLLRLKEEQDRALAETDSQLEQWNKFRSDYVAIQSRLKTLPDRTIHHVMVPFGSLAFMPGQLVHTNEILVLLGDNYFLERSACQAVDIVSRRLKELDRNIESLQKQRELLTPRAEFTSHMLHMTQGEGEQHEIVEPLDEEQERLWRERHREYLRQAGQKRKKEWAAKEKTGEKEMVENTDEELWERLDQLELQERQGRELQRLPEECQDLSQSAQLQEQLTEQGSRNLDAEDKLDEDEEEWLYEDEEDLSSLDVSDREESTDEEEEEDVHQTQRVITFSHTKVKNDKVSNRDSRVSSEDHSGLINSPADVYALVKASPRSILKTRPTETDSGRVQRAHRGNGQHKLVSFEGGSGETGVQERPTGVGQTRPRHVQDTRREDEKGDHSAACGEVQATAPAEPLVQAFSGTVVERQAQPLFTFHPQSPAPAVCGATRDQGASAVSGATWGQDAPASSQPISKFRAARQKADSETLTPSGGASQEQDSTSASTRPISKFRASRQKQDGIS